MNGFFKFLFAVVIIGVIGYVVYISLPESGQAYFKSVYQKQFDKEAQTEIKETQALVNPTLKTDYKTILESNSDAKNWVYQPKNADGTTKVFFYGSKVALKFSEIEGHEEKFYDAASVKIEFAKNADGDIKVYAYLNGNKTAEDEVIKASIFEQMLNGVATSE